MLIKFSKLSTGEPIIHTPWGYCDLEVIPGVRKDYRYRPIFETGSPFDDNIPCDRTVDVQNTLAAFCSAFLPEWDNEEEPEDLGYLNGWALSEKYC